ncbi:MAG TPA: hypothetical protein PK916_08795 [Bacteroidota bacterium]|nr:hypothetical protein [Bacteroidota bacterium]
MKISGLRRVILENNSRIIPLLALALLALASCAAPRSTYFERHILETRGYSPVGSASWELAGVWKRSHHLPGGLYRAELRIVEGGYRVSVWHWTGTARELLEAGKHTEPILDCALDVADELIHRREEKHRIERR